MKRLIQISAAIVLTSALVGCTTEGMVSATAIQPALGPVMDRHDSYVSADATLSDIEKQTYLRSTAIVRDILKAAGAPPK